MPKENPNAPDPPESAEQIELKDPVLAAVLAWLIPGLGHWYQGRRAKAALFFVCIMGTFAYGVYLGGSSQLGWGRVVYCSWRENDKRLPYLCQIGAGLPALPALIQPYPDVESDPKRAKKVWWHGFMAPPRLRDLPNDHPNAGQPTPHLLNLGLARYFEFGTAYTMIAGLLNVLAVYDAYGGPVISPPAKKEEDEDEEPKEDEND